MSFAKQRSISLQAVLQSVAIPAQTKALLSKKGPAFWLLLLTLPSQIRYCRSANPKLKMKGSKTLTSSQKSEG